MLDTLRPRGNNNHAGKRQFPLRARIPKSDYDMADNFSRETMTDCRKEERRRGGDVRTWPIKENRQKERREVISILNV
jgi:hypothetical protein